MDTKNVVLRVQQRLLDDVGLKTNKQDASSFIQLSATPSVIRCWTERMS